MTKHRLIAFTGPAGCGKTTAAKELHAHGYQIIRFAGPLKAMLRCLGLTEAHTDGNLKDEPIAIFGGRTTRAVMQTLGTEWGRRLVWEHIWIELWKRNVEKALAYGPVVCDDVRFENEVRIVRSLGGLVIYIKRPEAEDKRMDHVSERFAFLPDLWVDNNGSIEDFRAAIKDLKNGKIT